MIRAEWQRQRTAMDKMLLKLIHVRLLLCVYHQLLSLAHIYLYQMKMESIFLCDVLSSH